MDFYSYIKCSREGVGLHIFSYLAISSAIKSIPQVKLEVVLDILSLDIFIKESEELMHDLVEYGTMTA